MALLNESQLLEAAAELRGGGLIGLPTETVYGLAADAFNQRAVARIFERKGRPKFDPLIVHAATTEQAFELANETPAQAKKLAAAFWPGPMTLVLEKIERVPDLVTAGLSTVALRVPSHPLARKLIEASGTVLAAPSANRFGGVSPTQAADVLKELGGDLPVLDGGPCEKGLESTIIAVSGEKTRVLRLGSLAIEDIASVLGEQAEVVDFEASATEQFGDRPEAPGMLRRHYSPRTPLEIVTKWPQTSDNNKVGAIYIGEESDRAMGRFAATEQLSTSGDLVEAAAHLFAAMRRLDDAGLDRIYVKLASEQGIGRAINDRLRRAAADNETPV